tara:strand:- start:1867 stop:2025 length:159 start_codon:yes stop_codon:yes gene_type:complete
MSAVNPSSRDTACSPIIPFIVVLNSLLFLSTFLDLVRAPALNAVRDSAQVMR